MAQTWPHKKWKIVLLRLIDLIGRPLARTVRASRSSSSPAAPAVPSNILVIELWQIGDVVLATPFFRALRRCFPSARITLLGKSHAAELLAESGLVDEVIVAEVPWTKPEGKYAIADYRRASLGALVRTLRSRHFDLSFDARMDIRSNLLAALIGARRRIGFRHGGGDWLLTDSVAVDPKRNHKSDDWLALLGPMGCSPRTESEPLLRTSGSEKSAARRDLVAQLPGEGPIVAIHPGGSHAGKRWPLASFMKLAEELLRLGNRILVIEDPSGYGDALGSLPGAAAVRTSIRGMMATLEQCDVLVCNDSGPMHVAAALGVPTVAIFERGEPKWFSPIGAQSVVITGDLAGIAVSAVPASRPPQNPVAVSRVLQAVVRQLEGRKDAVESAANPRELY